MSGTVPKEYRNLAKQAKAAGWRIEVTGREHLRWTSPEGKVVFSSGTPSTQASRRALAGWLRRAGLELNR